MGSEMCIRDRRSNAIGLFHPFLTDESVKMYGVEAAGDGVETVVTLRR